MENGDYNSGENGLPHIWTRSGQRLYYNDPGPAICLEDIAHALSNLPRWTGHTSEFYSIAQHSVLVSRFCHTYPLEALLHDASEAYTGDINKPLKEMLGSPFKDIEHRLQDAVHAKFGLRVNADMKMKIKYADIQVAFAEARQFLNVEMHLGSTTDIFFMGEEYMGRVDGAIESWSPPQAEFMFLERYKELTK